jgi:type IV pilus assembly protein PilM
MGLDTATAAEKIAGFVVMIEGYSPYKNIGALLDPPNVKGDPSQWGLVTRLQNLKQYLNLDVNAPFKLALRGSDHFQLETGPVDVDSESLPRGVGAWKFIPSAAALAAAAANPYETAMGGTQDGTWTLIDPVTKETISAETVLDAYGKPRLDALGKPVKNTRDYWFKLRFKVDWVDAPATPTGVTTKSRR